jgi:hypothetical protein
VGVLVGCVSANMVPAQMQLQVFITGAAGNANFNYYFK